MCNTIFELFIFGQSLCEKIDSRALTISNESTSRSFDSDRVLAVPHTSRGFVSPLLFLECLVLEIGNCVPQFATCERIGLGF